MLSYMYVKSLIIFLRNNVKDNKKSVIFAPSDEKKILDTVRVGNDLLL